VETFGAKTDGVGIFRSGDVALNMTIWSNDSEMREGDIFIEYSNYKFTAVAHPFKNNFYVIPETFFGANPVPLTYLVEVLQYKNEKQRKHIFCCDYIIFSTEIRNFNYYLLA